MHARTQYHTAEGGSCAALEDYHVKSHSGVDESRAISFVMPEVDADTKHAQKTRHRGKQCRWEKMIAMARRDSALHST